ncbi:MAG: MerR family transcriptional regulator [Elusimicrobia bacterium]|nr:MerR family transcriptional regulator [Elusimicrobiota bacterium]
MAKARDLARDYGGQGQILPIKDTLPVFSISVVYKLTGVPVRMLREYEKYGLTRPRRLNGRRLYSQCEIGFIKDIRFYLMNRQMTIKGLKEFYLRSSCWEIKRCGHAGCPAYGNVKKRCWEVTNVHKKCNPEICPFCPIFLVKTAHKNKKDTPPISPRTFTP